MPRVEVLDVENQEIRYGEDAGNRAVFAGHRQASKLMREKGFRRLRQRGVRPDRDYLGRHEVIHRHHVKWLVGFRRHGVGLAKDASLANIAVGDHPRQFVLVIHNGQMAHHPPLHTLIGRADQIFRRHENEQILHGVLRHSILVGGGIADEQKAAQNIDFAEDADEPPLLQYWQAAKVAMQHVLRGQDDIGFRAHRGHVPGHAG